MTELEQLSHDSFYNMQDYSQITIDLIDELEDVLQEQDISLSLGALSYKIATVLDVLNPVLKTDKEALLKLIEIIEEQIK